LTGDARGDVILDALDAAGISENGRCHFDLLKVQHHASSHSTTQDFFERVTADHYVISGNGKDGNPHPDALRWLSNARHGQPFQAYLTNRTGLNDLSTMFDAFLAEEAQHEPAHVYRFRQDPASSITVELAS
jgi:beta-lactamase superfamily II metal-dependent hydrolase